MDSSKLMFPSVKSCFSRTLTNTRSGLSAFFSPVCQVVSRRIDHFYFSMQYFDNKLLNSIYWTTQTKPLLSWLTPIAYLVGEIKSDVSKKF